MKILKQNTIKNNLIYNNYLLFTDKSYSINYIQSSILFKNKKFGLISYTNKYNIILPIHRLGSQNLIYLTMKKQYKDETIFTTIVSKKLFKKYYYFLKNNDIFIKNIQNYKNNNLKQIFQILAPINGVVLSLNKYEISDYSLIMLKKWNKFLNLIRFKNLFFLNAKNNKP